MIPEWYIEKTIRVTQYIWDNSKFLESDPQIQGHLKYNIVQGKLFITIIMNVMFQGALFFHLK